MYVDENDNDPMRITMMYQYIFTRFLRTYCFSDENDTDWKIYMYCLSDENDNDPMRMTMIYIFARYTCISLSQKYHCTTMFRNIRTACTSIFNQNCPYIRLYTNLWRLLITPINIKISIWQSRYIDDPRNMYSCTYEGGASPRSTFPLV